MTNTNKYLLLFLGTGIVLIGVMLSILLKSLPLMLEHSVYYCQQLVHSFTAKTVMFSGKMILFTCGVILIILVYKIICMFMEVRKLRKYLVLHEKPGKSLARLLKKLHLEKDVTLIRSDKPFAFCFGIRWPKIYISQKIISMMTKKELTAILLHEGYHLKHRDSFTIFFVSIVQLFFPFFPLLTDFISQYKINREIAADHYATKMLGDKSPLISVLKKLLQENIPLYISAASIAESETLEPRINALIQGGKKYRTFHLKNIFISFLSSLILSGFLFTPVQAVELPSKTQSAVMVCLPGGACVPQCKEKMGEVSKDKKAHASYPYSMIK